MSFPGLIWVKVATDFHRHPRIMAAGRDARELFLWFLCLNGAEAADGRIPRSAFSERVAAVQLGMTPGDVRDALRVLAEPDIRLIRDEEDAIVLLDWDDEWRPKLAASSTERVKKHRAKYGIPNGHVTRGNARETEIVSPSLPGNGATPGNGDLRSEKVEKRDPEEALVAGATEEPREAAPKAKRERPEPSSEAVRVAGHLVAAIRSHTPDWKPAKGTVDATVRRWAQEFDGPIRRKTHEPAKLCRAIDFAHADSFWRSNILSARTLIDKYEQLRIRAREALNQAPRSRGDVDHVVTRPAPTPIPVATGPVVDAEEAKAAIAKVKAAIARRPDV